MERAFDDPLDLRPPATQCERRSDGSFILRSPHALPQPVRCVGEWLQDWAQRTPDAVAFAERVSPQTWNELTWAQTRERVGRLAQALLDLQLAQDDPVVVLSDNSLHHLLLMLACLQVGRAVCTVSSAYSRLSQDHAKVTSILKTLRPGLVYADNAQVYGPAIRAAQAAGLNMPVLLSHGAADLPGALVFDELAATVETPAVMQAFARITPDTVAKYLLTSGSTGMPKVVINTHRMLCANQEMLASAWLFLEHEKPVVVDWLPWSHTFGGNHNLHIVMRNGGTLVIDEGRPAPGLVEKSLANLVKWKPTLYFNVPRGLDLILPLLEADPEAARAFFSRLRMVFYAGAGMPQATWDRLQALSRRVRGQDLWLTTSWGATETAPAITLAHFRLERAGNIGIPLPGVDLKFVPNGGKLEMRVRGINVFPGYRHAPELTAQAFDEEGYYCIGDAGLLVDDEHPEKGIIFNGRVAEDFKLTTGTWVSVGTLRLKLVSALAPWAQDAVITGHDRDEVGALIFPSAAAAALPPTTLQDHIKTALKALKAEGGGSSQVPMRALVLGDPPSADGGEITDKGYINQRAVLTRRAPLVQALYEGGAGVITLK
ncbi:MAG: feruloyl-CoA synthase [Burkholderiales bacterium]|nr:feruloyl-CoA synthase [Burkholderiales bacterium]